MLCCFVEKILSIYQAVYLDDSATNLDLANVQVWEEVAHSNPLVRDGEHWKSDWTNQVIVAAGLCSLQHLMASGWGEEPHVNATWLAMKK